MRALLPFLFFQTCCAVITFMSILSYNPTINYHHVQWTVKSFQIAFDRPVVAAPQISYGQVILTINRWGYNGQGNYIPSGTQCGVNYNNTICWVTLLNGTGGINSVVSVNYPFWQQYSDYGTKYDININKLSFFSATDATVTNPIVGLGSTTPVIYWDFYVDSIPDVIPPTVSALLPPDDTANPAPAYYQIDYNQFSINFNKPVIAQNGSISLYQGCIGNYGYPLFNSSITSYTLITSVLANLTTIDDATHTIVTWSFPGHILQNYTTWYDVVVDPWAFSDTAGLTNYGNILRTDESPNYFAGYSARTWNFRTRDHPDYTVPYVFNTTLIPALGSNVSLYITNFQFTLSKIVYPNDGTITITSGIRTTTGLINLSNIFVLNTNDTSLTSSFDYTRNFTTFYFSVDPSLIANYTHIYYVSISDSAFKDVSELRHTSQVFGGPTEWYFDTNIPPDYVTPKYLAINPPTGTNTIRTGLFSVPMNITVNVDKKIYQNTSFTGPVITVKSGSQVISTYGFNITSIVFSGVYPSFNSTLTIALPYTKYSMPLYSTVYSVVIAEGAFNDLYSTLYGHDNLLCGVPCSNSSASFAGSNFLSIFPNNTYWLQTIDSPDLIPPVPILSVPAVGATNVRLPVQNFTIYWSKMVQSNLVSAGKIKLFKIFTNNNTLATLDVISSTSTAIVNSIVTNSTVISIPAGQILPTDYLKSYYLTIPGDYFVDYATVHPNYFHGYFDSSNFNNFLLYGEWSFTTQAQPAVIISTISVGVAKLIQNSTYSIVLSTNPDLNVVVNIRSNHTAFYMAHNLTGVSYGALTSVASVTFTSSNWNIPQFVTVFACPNKLDLACFDGDVQSFDTLNHTIVSADPQFNPLNNLVMLPIASVGVSILTNDLTILPPNLLSAQFDPQLSSITATFSSFIYSNGNIGSFPCSSYWVNTFTPLRSSSTTFLGSQLICTFLTDGLGVARLMQIQFNSDANNIVGDKLVLANNMIRTNGRSQFYATGQNVVILPPAVIVNPVLTITGATTLGQCDDLFLSAISTMSGGRPVIYEWVISSPAIEAIVAQNSTLFEVIINNWQKLNPGSWQTDDSKKINTLFIANTLLSPNEKYTITVTATNFLGYQSAPVVVNVYKTPLVKPYVAIDGGGGGNVIIVHRKGVVSLSAVANAPACQSSNSTGSTMVVSWYQIAGDVYPVTLQATNNPRVVQIPSMALQVNATYHFGFNAYMKADPLTFNNDSVTYFVQPVNVVVYIYGSKVVTQNILYPFSIDASGSRNDDSTYAVWWTFLSWSCAVYNDTDREMTGSVTNCLDQSGNNITDAYFNTLANNTFILPISTTSLAKNHNYIFTVTAGASSTNYGSDYVKIRYVDTNVPIIQTSIVQDGYKGLLINPSKQLSIVANIQSAIIASIRIEWNQTYGDIVNLATLSLTGINRNALVFAPNALTPGQNYGFQITAIDELDNEALNVIQIQVNSPPYGGSFSVYPAAGNATKTIFSLTASGWSTNPYNYPLSYTFYTIILSSIGGFTTETVNPISATQLNQFYNTTLPLGFGSKSTLTLQVDITDALGSTTTRFFSVQSFNPAVGHEIPYVAGQINGTLQQKLQVGDPLQIIGAINGIAAILNNVSYTNVADMLSCTQGVTCQNGGICTRNSNGITYFCDCSLVAYDGQYCETSSDVHLAKIDARYSLISALLVSNTTTILTSNAITQQANILNTVASCTTETNSTLHDTNILALSSIVSASKSVGMDSGLAVTLGNTMSNMIDSSNYLNSGSGVDAGTAGHLDEVSTTLSHTLLTNVQPGQQAVVINSKNLNIAAKVDTSNNLANANFTFASNSSSDSGAVKPSFTFPNSLPSLFGNSTQGPSLVSFHAKQWNVNPYASQTSSGNVTGGPVVSLTFSQNGNEVPINGLQDYFVISIPRNTPNVSSLWKPNYDKSTLIRYYVCPYNTTGTFLMGDIHNRPVPCPSADGKTPQFLSINCTGGSPMRMKPTIPLMENKTCPELVLVPSCKYWDHKSNSWSGDGCVLADDQITNNPDGNTICHCKHLTNFGTLLTATFDDAGSVLSSAQYLDINVITKNIVVVATILGMYVAFIVFCFFGRRKDMQQEQDLKVAKASKFNKMRIEGKDIADIPDIVSEQDQRDKERLDGGKHACIQCMGSGTIYQVFNDPNSPIVECNICFGSGQEYACIDCKGRGFINQTKEEKEKIRTIATLSVGSPNSTNSPKSPEPKPKPIATLKSLKNVRSDPQLDNKLEERIIFNDISGIAETTVVTGMKSCAKCRGTGRTNCCTNCLGSGRDLQSLDECHECFGTGNQAQTSVRIFRKFVFEIKKTHPWLSIYFFYNEGYTRPQRLTVLLCLIMADMFTNAFLFDINHPDPLVNPPVDPASKVGFGIIASLISMPVTIMFVLLFKRAQAAKNSTYILLEKELMENHDKKAVDIAGGTQRKKDKLQKLAQNSEQEPYVTAYCTPFLFSQKVRTARVKSGQGLNPVFTEDHENHMQIDYPGTQATDAKPQLRVEVWDYDRFTPADLIGLVDIPIWDFISRPEEKIEKWYNLVDHHTMDRGKMLLEIWFEKDPEEYQSLSNAPLLTTINSHERVSAVKNEVLKAESQLRTTSEALKAAAKIDSMQLFNQKLYNRKQMRRMLNKQTEFQIKRLNDLKTTQAEYLQKLSTANLIKSSESSHLNYLSTTLRGKKKASSIMVEKREEKLRLYQELQLRYKVLATSGTIHCIVKKGEGLADMDLPIKNMVINELLGRANYKFQQYNKKQMLEEKIRLSDEDKIVTAKAEKMAVGKKGIERLLFMYKSKNTIRKELRKKIEDDERESFISGLDESMRQQMKEIDDQVAKLDPIKKALYDRFFAIKIEKKVKPLPMWIDTLVYILATLYCAFTGFYVILFGISKQSNLTNAWIQSLLVAQLTGALFNKPFASLLSDAVLPVVASSVVGLRTINTDKLKQYLEVKERTSLGIENIHITTRAIRTLIKNSKALTQYRADKKREEDRIAAMKHKVWTHKEHGSKGIEDPFDSVVEVVKRTVFKGDSAEDMGLSANDFGIKVKKQIELVEVAKVRKKKVKIAHRERLKDVIIIEARAVKQIDKQVDDNTNAQIEQQRMEKERIEKEKKDLEDLDISYQQENLYDMMMEEMLQRSKGDLFYGVDREKKLHQLALENRQREEAEERERERLIIEDEKKRIELEQKIQNQDRQVMIREMHHMAKEESKQRGYGDNFWGIEYARKLQNERESMMLKVQMEQENKRKREQEAQTVKLHEKWVAKEAEEKEKEKKEKAEKEALERKNYMSKFYEEKKTTVISPIQSPKLNLASPPSSPANKNKNNNNIERDGLIAELSKSLDLHTSIKNLPFISSPKIMKTGVFFKEDSVSSPASKIEEKKDTIVVDGTTAIKMKPPPLSSYSLSSPPKKTISTISPSKHLSIDETNTSSKSTKSPQKSPTKK